ncbi:MAG TPA: hypothetical protein VGB11_03035 [Candidatus Bathyarchaeia archaeon]
MMKAILIGITFSMLLLSCLLCRVPVIKADMMSSGGFTVAYQPYIVFPSNYATYNSGLLTLNVSFHAMIYGNAKYYMTYSLDGKETETLPLVVYYYGSWIINPENWERNHIDGSVILPELSEGSHSITVYLECDWEIGNAKTTWHEYYYDNQTVYFTIKNITIQTPSPSSTTPSSTPSPTPQQQTAEPTQSDSITSFAPDFPLIIVCIAVIGAVVAVIIVHFRKEHR